MGINVILYTMECLHDNDDITFIHIYFFFYPSQREVDKKVARDPAIFTFRESDPAITSLAFGLRFTR